jgi:hypothetical protein
VTDREGVNLGVNRLFINTDSEVIDSKPVCGQVAQKLGIDGACDGISPPALTALPVTTQ